MSEFSSDHVRERGPRSRQRAAERKDALMNCALLLFAKEGFDKTPVSAITRAAGVSQGTFYWYFKTKDHVLVSLIERALMEGASAALAIMNLPLSGQAKVLHAVGYLQNLLAKDRVLWKVVHARTLDSGEVERAHAQAHEAIVVPFKALIGEGLQDGSITLTTPVDLVARLIVAMVDYAFTDELTRDEPEVLDTVKRLVEAMLSSRGGGGS